MEDLVRVDQRYFAGTGAGRFLSSDPYEASGGASAPGSWNRFAYVGGDPVNANDPRGLYAEQSDGWFPGDLDGSIMLGFGDPFAGLGSNSGMNGPMRKRNLACFTESCTQWSVITPTVAFPDGMLGAWNAGPDGTYEVMISEDHSAFLSFVQSSECRCEDLRRIFGEAVNQQVGAMVRLTLPLFIMLNEIFKKAKPIGRPRVTPTGTLGLDRYPGLSHDEKETIKECVDATPTDWVGIAPNDGVITGSPGGGQVNHGPYRNCLP